MSREIKRKMTTPVFTVDKSNPYAGVISYTDEDHTLGNTLRHYLLQHPNVPLAAYRMTHPLKNEMTVSVVTDNTKSVPEVVNETLDQLVILCEDLQSQLSRQLSI